MPAHASGDIFHTDYLFFILTISVNIGVCEYDLVSRGCGVVII